MSTVTYRMLFKSIPSESKPSKHRGFLDLESSLSYTADVDDMAEIEACIKVLKGEREALKAENVLLTHDIRRIKALDAEKARVIRDIRARYSRLASSNLIVTQNAVDLEKKARSLEKAKRNDLTTQELCVRRYVVLDQESGTVMLANEHSHNRRTKDLFKDYQQRVSALRTSRAAHDRLEQVLTEHLGLCDLIHKVKNIAIGPSDPPNKTRNTSKGPLKDTEENQQKTPPAIRRPSLCQRRISLPVATINNAPRPSESVRMAR